MSATARCFYSPGVCSEGGLADTRESPQSPRTKPLIHRTYRAAGGRLRFNRSRHTCSSSGVALRPRTRVTGSPGSNSTHEKLPGRNKPGWPAGINQKLLLAHSLLTMPEVPPLVPWLQHLIIRELGHGAFYLHVPNDAMYPN